MAYRIVVCVDVEADSLKEAYGKVYDYMAPSCRAATDDIEWESSDEWFDDDQGEPGDPAVLQEARMAVYKDRNPDEF